MDGVGSQEKVSSSESYWTPLLISMAGIVSTSLALVLYHFILVRYCLRRSGMGRRGLLLLSNRFSTRPILAPGVDDKILGTIPILSYSTDIKANKLFRVDQSECVICLGELEDGDKIRLLPNCRHAFHVPCIDEWFSARTNCPVCRSPIVATNLTNSVVPLAVEQNDGVGNSMTTRFRVEEGGEPVNGSRPVRPNGLLRHCVSVALPVEGKSMCVVTELKRSMSMDQSDRIVIDIQTLPDQMPSSSSSSSSKPVLMRSRSYNKTIRSLRKLDRMSSTIARSLSQLQIGC